MRRTHQDLPDRHVLFLGSIARQEVEEASSPCPTKLFQDAAGLRSSGGGHRKPLGVGVSKHLAGQSGNERHPAAKRDGKGHPGAAFPRAQATLGCGVAWKGEHPGLAAWTRILRKLRVRWNVATSECPVVDDGPPRAAGPRDTPSAHPCKRSGGERPRGPHAVPGGPFYANYVCGLPSGINLRG